MTDVTTNATHMTTRDAGLDVGKTGLDLALHERPGRWHLHNTAEGHAELVVLLIRFGVSRIGLEASGGYERGVVEALRQAGLEVVLFQPRQVRAYATFRLRRAKTDLIDAGLIAACTAAHGTIRPAPDPRIADMAEPLRLVEQIDEDVARFKTRLEAYRDEGIREHIQAEIKRLRTERATRIKALIAALQAHDDLGRRFALVASVPGIGERTALTLIVRMPELGRLTREEAASLAGLAPFDHSSGQHQGRRCIAGGRASVRKALYAAALPAAFRWNQALVSLYRRLTAAGKTHKQTLVACARKLLIFANTVLARNTPWIAR